jgi:hypothetical protein
MPELTITSPSVHSRINFNTFTMGGQPYARVDIIPHSGTLGLASEGKGEGQYLVTLTVEGIEGWRGALKLGWRGWIE